jgi:hypothetical protein
VFLGALAHRVGMIIVHLSVSGRYTFSKNGSNDCFLEVNNFGKSNFIFHTQSTIYSIRRNSSGFREYVHCMSRHHDTWVNVPHWLTKKDFNSSDCFRHRL